jgi:hypothetical protein
MTPDEYETWCEVASERDDARLRKFVELWKH